VTRFFFSRIRFFFSRTRFFFSRISAHTTADFHMLLNLTYNWAHTDAHIMYDFDSSYITQLGRFFFSQQYHGRLGRIQLPPRIASSTDPPVCKCKCGGS
jgi:hypothetical protein